MDDELQQLEAELKSLRPSAASPHLHRRVAQELATAPRRGWRPHLPWLWVVALPVAAAVAMIFLPNARRIPAPDNRSEAPRDTAAADAAAGEVLKPVTVENVLYAAQDEGLVTLDDGTPARRERLNFVDTIVWQNPRTKASLTWKVPREEIRVVPVSFQ